MLPKEITEYLDALTRDASSPVEELMLMGIAPLTYCCRRMSATWEFDEEEYNDEFDDETGEIDEEPYEDYNRDGTEYIDDEEYEEYDLKELAEFPLLNTITLYNNNRRKYYA